MSAHTPGPWRAGTPWQAGQRTAPLPVVAIYGIDVRHGVNGSICGLTACEEGKAEVHANARLIAAAPDLLAAGNVMVEALAARQNREALVQSAWGMLVAAIGKATGQEVEA